jgi:hypothetical protein
MRAALAVFFVLLWSCALFAADVTATLSPQSATVGDTLHLELKLNGAGGQAVTFPRVKSDTVTVLKVDSTRIASQATICYTLAIYDTGRFAIGPWPVVVGRGADAETLYTQRLGVAIKSVLPDSAKAILPIKPYREHPFQLRELLAYWWVLAVIAAGVLGWWVWRRFFSKRAKEEAEAAAPLLPPHDEAVRGLIALKGKSYPSRGMLKEFFSEYSLIMRRYLERRYDFPALEMTTFDLARELDEGHYPEIIQARLLPVLRESDLVKFAKHHPDFRECDAYIETGFELVAQTQAAQEAEAAEPAEEKAA